MGGAEMPMQTRKDLFGEGLSTPALRYQLVGLVLIRSISVADRPVNSVIRAGSEPFASIFAGNLCLFFPTNLIAALLDSFLDAAALGLVERRDADVFFLFALFEDGPQPFVGVDPFHFFHGHEQLLLILEIFRKFFAGSVLFAEPQYM